MGVALVLFSAERKVCEWNEELGDDCATSVFFFYSVHVGDLFCVLVWCAAGFSLSQKHGIKIVAGSTCNVEDVGLAVGWRIRHRSVNSANKPSCGPVFFF